MSVKFPRRSFAAPLVVTLAVPACLVTSGKPPPPSSGGTSSSSSGEVRDHRGETQTHVNPPGPHTNPPRPATDTAHPGHEQTTPPPRDPQPGNDSMQQAPPTEPTSLRSWTVFVNGKDCFTSYDVTCPPKGATCNPPPPSKLASCPSGITAGRPLKIKEDTANACALYYPMPDCPAGVACNPPRPQKIDCPTR